MTTILQKAHMSSLNGNVPELFFEDIEKPGMGWLGEHC